MRIGRVAIGHATGGDLLPRVVLAEHLAAPVAGPSVSSAPNTVGSPTARAASAKRTTP